MPSHCNKHNVKWRKAWSNMNIAPNKWLNRKSEPEKRMNLCIPSVQLKKPETQVYYTSENKGSFSRQTNSLRCTQNITRNDISLSHLIIYISHPEKCSEK